MHQEHNVPWNALASNFKFIRDYPHYTPRVTGLFPRQLPTQANTLNHFKRVLHSTITTFSETERRKYDPSFPAPTTGNLFHDEFRDRFPEFLDKTNQSMDTWMESAKAVRNLTPSQLGYSSRNADLAEAMKVLISENEMKPLLMLARHPQISHGMLRNLVWGPRFGFSRVMETALHAYVEINMWAAMGLLEDGEYQETKDYRWMLYNGTERMAYRGHQLPHKAHFDALPKNEKAGLPEIHRDFAGLKEYLKTNFRLLYRYDMFLKECGLDAEWENAIVSLFEDKAIGMDTKIVCIKDDDGKCTKHFD